MKYLLTVLITFNIFASFSGKWVGEGYYFTERSEGACKEVFFRFFEDEKTFKIQEGGYNCSFMNAEYPYSVFHKKGSSLYYRGEEVGSFSSDKITLSYYDGVFTLELVLVEGKVIFKELWQDGDDLLVIKSELESLD